MPEPPVTVEVMIVIAPRHTVSSGALILRTAGETTDTSITFDSGSLQLLTRSVRSTL